MLVKSGLNPRRLPVSFPLVTGRIFETPISIAKSARGFPLRSSLATRLIF